MAGAGLAFLWFNATRPRSSWVTWARSRLGGALGTIAVIVRQEIVLAIMGGIFVVEALSGDVAGGLLQVHQEALRRGPPPVPHGAAAPPLREKGWKETQVVVRFWIITMLLCLIGLSTLKLR
jgi:phospho-N-acetylmuramoyl-pentapeptide-transferase